MSQAFEIGQRISVGEVTGTIHALESSAVVLRTESEQLVRLPNHLLLESAVTLYDTADR